jgi:UDP-glucuronate 4-epimerase
MSEHCVLGDCYKEYCHHCFPVLNCKKHDICIEKGMFEEYSGYKFNQTINIVVTGCAGFIGSHFTEFILKKGYNVYGIDNLNDYYDVTIKHNNINILSQYKNFKFFKEDIRNTNIINHIKPTYVVHLASMAGVRYSIKNPCLYNDINVNGFYNILEQCVKTHVKQLVYASSSSVYGLNKKIPFSEDDTITTCNSPYACSKVSMELNAKTYYQLYNLQSIGLRFFTVYGPRGRPDMAPFKFMSNIKNGIPIDKYGDGSSGRDYTYIDDIVNGIYSSMINTGEIQCEVINLGNSNPISLNSFIELCEKKCSKKAIINQLDEQLGDVPFTCASIEKAKLLLNYQPKTKLEDGLQKLYDSL